MNYFEHFTKDTSLHHAYLIEGDREDILPSLYRLFDQIGITYEANPDVLVRSFSVFTIEDSRFFKTADAHMAHTAGKKIFVIAAESFTHEALEALLKVLEDPKAGTHFFIITPRPGLLPATVLSRVQLIHAVNLQNTELVLAKKFLAFDAPERLAHITKMLAKAKDAEEGENAKLAARKLLQGLELILHEQFLTQSTAGKTTLAKQLKTLAQAGSYLNDRGASVKMILEHVSLSL